MLSLARNEIVQGRLFPTTAIPFPPFPFPSPLPFTLTPLHSLLASPARSREKPALGLTSAASAISLSFDDFSSSKVHTEVTFPEMFVLTYCRLTFRDP